ncbi:MAG: NUMOD3 motif protein [Cellulomonas sp.]|uniref:NUMOD3 domain-containing DNA-binding protein n=1 Tax=Cellulomonas sp. TaxID=40001 RepID=UPI0019FD8A8A|nr:NUMOD3 domain-containing DNA-binding protein [Cellulomonas sp.]MBF0688612.1 NUMOD3 motif protein [Cellulomonas sp.]
MTDRLDESGAVGYVYGIRLASSREYRYVGLTEMPVQRRLMRHTAEARAGRKTPFYDWLRRELDSDVVVDVLEEVRTSRDDLGHAEARWIVERRAVGDRLLNLTDGGLGPKGVVWTEEQREAARRRATGRRGVSRYGAENPFYGQGHTQEQRARWSERRRGQNVGAANPNFGRFGEEHPAYGRFMAEEQRRALSESRTGELNPNFGKSASAETRAKMSAARKGRPMPSSRRSANTRYHTNQGRTSPTCTYCQQDAVAVAEREERP